jgi:hypothetical protein
LSGRSRSRGRFVDGNVYGENGLPDVAAHGPYDVEVAFDDVAGLVGAADPPAEPVAEFAGVAVDVALRRAAEEGDGATFEQGLEVEGEVESPRP